MRGACRLSDDEVTSIANSFSGRYALRNRCLFLLGCSTGGRISELLSLKVVDVWQYEKPVDTIYFKKAATKGNKTGRAVPIKKAAQMAILQLILWYLKNGIEMTSDMPLFLSQKGGSITRQQAHDILKVAFSKAQVQGNVTTHSMRKTYADRLLKQGGNLYAVKEALGHSSVATTQEYLGIDPDELREATPDYEVSDIRQVLSDLETEGDRIALLEDRIRLLEPTGREMASLFLSFVVPSERRHLNKC
jgi:integrase/recombinase XerD